MADEFEIHAYEQEYKRHQAAALRFLNDVAETATRLLENPSMNPAVFAGELERIARDALMASVRAAQVDALNEVRFLAKSDDLPADGGERSSTSAPPAGGAR